MKPINTHSIPKRLAAAKAAYTTRRVNLKDAVALLNNNISPRAGDLVLARVMEIGQHQRIELANGRRARMFVGDELVLAYGNRYAPDQFEATVPDSLTPCHLAAAGGIASQVISKHDKMNSPTVLDPLGLLGDVNGKPLNLADFAVKKIGCHFRRPLTIAVVGTSMNAGKTTTAASLIRGLVAGGMLTGAAKVTGTGEGGDVWYMRDAGAHRVLDFVDAGFPSTYRVPFGQVEEIVTLLTDNLRHAGAEAIVLEVADGLYQAETARLLTTAAFKDNVDGVIFTASDAMGGSAGAAWLQEQGLPVVALSGALTRSSLSIREAREAVGFPVLTKKSLADPTIADHIKGWVAGMQSTRNILLRAV
jgi:hypothetical protein